MQVGGVYICKGKVEGNTFMGFIFMPERPAERAMTSCDWFLFKWNGNYPTLLVGIVKTLMVNFWLKGRVRV